MISSTELNDTLIECYRSDKLFAKTFFPEAFSGPMTKLHDAIFELTDSKEKLVCIAAPRGIGKTTISRTKLAKNILYRDSLFCPYVSKSHDASLLQTENLKRDLASNLDIRKVFGPIKPQNLDIDFQESFSKKSWVAYDTLVMPRGYGQQIRGLVYNNIRPDLFIIDDLEDDDIIENPDYRRKLKEWFFGTLMQAVSRYSSNYRIIYIDTLKHEDSLLQLLLDSKEWATTRLELFDENEKSCVPELYSDECIQELIGTYRDKGMMDVLYREARNLPIAQTDATFQSSYFKYSDPVEVINKVGVEKVVLVDPAKTVKLHSADSAIVGVSIDTKDHAIHVVDIDAGKMLPDDLYDRMFNMCDKIGANTLAVEVTSLSEFIQQPIKNEASKRGFKGSIVWLQARGGENQEKGKLKRIAALAPYYRQGNIYHNKLVCGILEEQLLSFPRSKRLDVMDAFAYIIELLDVGNFYFDCVATHEEDEDDFWDLYKDNDDPVENWRVA